MVTPLDPATLPPAARQALLVVPEAAPALREGEPAEALVLRLP